VSVSPELLDRMADLERVLFDSAAPLGKRKMAYTELLGIVAGEWRALVGQAAAVGSHGPGKN